jgi:hypothetical protein
MMQAGSAVPGVVYNEENSRYQPTAYRPQQAWRWRPLAIMSGYSQSDHVREQARGEVDGGGELHQDWTNLLAELVQGAL